VATALLWAAVAGASARRAEIEEGVIAVLTDKQEVGLEARPLKGEGIRAFSRRFTDGELAVQAIAQANGQPKRLEAGVRYRVPYALLKDDYKVRVVRALFPQDVAQPTGWRHIHPKDAPPLSLWQLSEVFTGKGENHALLRKHNDLADDSLASGQALFIPAEILLSPFQALLPPEPVAPAPAPPPAATPLIFEGEPGSNELAYARDGAGRYAVYRLKRGEALYSAVVVRFTGRTFAEDVNALAAELATLNAIKDVTDMPIGQPIRIPLDLLLPEYLPADDPRFQEYERNREAVDKIANPVRAKALEGIHIVLDAGHGGHDPGVDFQGVWESTYVYDVMVRAKHLLEQYTSATVIATTRDGGEFRLHEADVLPRSREHLVLTKPVYPIRDARVSTNLRWYLANSAHRDLQTKGVDPGKMLFLSIHADSLHHSLRGAMAYVPSTTLTQGEFGKSGDVYAAREEVREQPSVSFSFSQRQKSEGLSRRLAEHLLRSFQRRGLAVHKEKAIRDRIIRCSRCRAFVPAVVRYNAVPTKLLLEICNMNNAEDRRLLTTRAFRQNVAHAVVDGILAHYGQQPLAGEPPKMVGAGGQRAPITERRPQ
jgi:N-acetylmuramoyl-L-alanine amidase